MTATPNRPQEKSAAERARVILARADLTPGPWVHDGGRMVRCRPGGDTVPARTQADAEFIAASRTLVPELAAENEALQKELEECRSLRDLSTQALERRTQELLRTEDELATSRAATDKTRIEADAALSQVPRWRPIETAPRDGTWMLALYLAKDDDVGYARYVVLWCKRDMYKADRWCNEHKEYGVPLAWMPLPLPPKETT